MFAGWKDSAGSLYYQGQVISVQSDMSFAAYWVEEGNKTEIDGQLYDSVESAFAVAEDGTSIDILQDTTASDLKFETGKYSIEGISFNLNGKTMTIVSPVGSTGTVTNDMQLLKGNKVGFRDGICTAGTNAVIFLIQNYSDLILDNVTLIGGSVTRELLSINNGTVILRNSTVLTELSSSDTVADLYYWPKGSYTDGCGLIIEDPDVEIQGKLEINHDRTDAAGFPDKVTLIVPDGYQDNLEIGFNAPGFTYSWVPCERKGYTDGYVQMKISSL